jgi:hypothetical protein
MTTNFPNNQPWPKPNHYAKFQLPVDSLESLLLFLLGGQLEEEKADHSPINMVYCKQRRKLWTLKVSQQPYFEVQPPH